MVTKYIIDRADIYDLLMGKELSLSQPSRTRAFSVKIAGEMTNGDMIKALFPNIEIADCTKFNEVYTEIPFGELIGANIDCMRDWWNAPYREGDEK